MKALMYEWNSYLQKDVYGVLKKEGFEIDVFSWMFEDKNVDDIFEHKFEARLYEGDYEFVFSVNYWPLISKCCQKKGIRYIAWCYDNPLNVLNIEDTIDNSVNTVVLFDRVQAQGYIDKGIETVYYLPLAVNTERLNRIKISSKDSERYSAQISFVGSLYESKILEIRSFLDDYSQGYLDSVIKTQTNLYGSYLIDEMVTERWIQEINNRINNMKTTNNSFSLLKEALVFAIASEVTRRERILLLTLLGKRFDTKIYSYNNDDIMQYVKKCLPVDYYLEMPKVFASSRVNLNPTLKCIQSGIPLRALDIMGMKGFLLSNYQDDLAYYFENEKEVVMFDSVEDACDKAKFYLSHEELRFQICINGYEKIQKEFDMRSRIRKILELANVR